MTSTVRRRWWRRPQRRTAVVVLIVGLVLGVPATVGGVQVLLRSIDGPTLNVPGTTQVHLKSGRWVIFQRTGSKSDYGPVHTSENGPPTIAVRNVTVVGAAGASPVRPLSGTQTITSGSKIYTGAVEFSVPREGDYTISITSTRSAEAMVTRSFTDTFRSVAPWAVVAFVGFVVAILGFIFVIVPANRLGAATPTHQFPMTPPGWYPDPADSTRWRWWDGYRWTEHAADGNR